MCDPVAAQDGEQPTFVHTLSSGATQPDVDPMTAEVDRRCDEFGVARAYAEVSGRGYFIFGR